MKALSIQQPWAWLIVNGLKDIENRTWITSYRGRILVHAGKKFDGDGYRYIVENWRTILGDSKADALLPMAGKTKEQWLLQMGGIVGEVDIVGCDDKSTSPWFFGPIGFQLANAKPLQLRPLRGQLGFFDVPV